MIVNDYFQIYIHVVGYLTQEDNSTIAVNNIQVYQRYFISQVYNPKWYSRTSISGKLVQANNRIPPDSPIIFCSQREHFPCIVYEYSSAEVASPARANSGLV